MRVKDRNEWKKGKWVTKKGKHVKKGRKSEGENACDWRYEGSGLININCKKRESGGHNLRLEHVVIWTKLDML